MREYTTNIALLILRYLSLDEFAKQGHSYHKCVPMTGDTNADDMAESEGALGKKCFRYALLLPLRAVSVDMFYLSVTTSVYL
jgi:hypothetical protein